MTIIILSIDKSFMFVFVAAAALRNFTSLIFFSKIFQNHLLWE